MQPLHFGKIHCFFILFITVSPTGRKPPCAEEDDDEDVEKITDITVTLLMNVRI